MKHYSDNEGLLVLSYNGIYNSVLSNRTYGKTWLFKKRAVKRALKRGRKTIWLRLFKNEAKECIDTFFSSKDLQKFCGVSYYDKDTNPNGNLRREGNTFLLRKMIKGKWSKWFWFLKVFKLGDAGALRSADDVKIDTIIFDEFTKPANKYRLYRGNIANDFIDIFFSIKREHQVRCIFIGNKESVSNPIFTYFGITPPPAQYEGIRRYRNGSFIIQQINNLPKSDSEYDTKVEALFKGTAYGNFIYKSTYKEDMAFKTRRMPAGAAVYTQININNQPIKIAAYNGCYYVNTRIVNSRHLYCDKLAGKSANERLLVNRLKRFFVPFIEALKDNRVYYDSPVTYERAQAFIQWLNV